MWISKAYGESFIPLKDFSVYNNQNQIFAEFIKKTMSDTCKINTKINI